MSATSRRRIAALVLSALLVPACATGRGADRDLVEAGRRIRLEQPPPTAEELRREVGSLLDNELPLLRRKADAARERATRRWRLTFVGGSALGVLAATSGSLTGSDGAAKPVLTTVGAAAAVVGGVAWAFATTRLGACVAFLDAAREDVASFRESGIPPGEGTVGVAVWRSWVDRVAAIRGQEACAGIR